MNWFYFQNVGTSRQNEKEDNTAKHNRIAHLDRHPGCAKYKF